MVPATKATAVDTKTRILEATLESLHTNGIVGTSARVIAGIGDFNQALIFYHFGSVNDAVVAAIGMMAEQQRDRYRARLVETTSLAELAAVARDLHNEDLETGSTFTLVQAFAGSASDPEMGKKLYGHLEEWIDVIAESIERLLADTPSDGMISSRELAFGISALFLGVELLNAMDPERAPAGELLDSLGGLASVAQMLLESPLLQSLGAINKN